MNEQSLETSNLQSSSLRNSRSSIGLKNSKLFSKIASTVKFVLRATNDVEANTPNGTKKLLRKDSRSIALTNKRKSLIYCKKIESVMRVAYIGANGQLNYRALLVPTEKLEGMINLENNEDRKVAFYSLTSYKTLLF